MVGRLPRKSITLASPEHERIHGTSGTLIVHAQNGEVRCQYAVASIYWMGLCCDTEEQYQAEYPELIAKATQWWVLSAAQGWCAAIDNIVTAGVGPVSDRIRAASRQLELDRPDLIGRSMKMPVYGPEFMQELCNRCFPQQ